MSLEEITLLPQLIFIIYGGNRAWGEGQEITLPAFVRGEGCAISPVKSSLGGGWVVLLVLEAQDSIAPSGLHNIPRVWKKTLLFKSF